MRTLDATLRSVMATGHFVPYFKLKVYRAGNLLSTLDVLKYRLSGTHLSVTTRGLISISTSPENIKIVLERGITQNGSNRVLDSSRFTPITGWIERLSSKSLYVATTVEAELVPPRPVSFAGDASYTEVITSFCTSIGKTPVFRNAGAAYWGYQFMPAGTVITLNNAQAFLPLLMQKRLIFACDNGGEQILFYCALDIPAGNFDASIDPVLFSIGTGYFGRRRFFATDENRAVRFAGTAGDPLFNLGFIKSTENLPPVYAQAQPLDFTIPVDLTYQNGDFIGVDSNNYALYPAEVTEVFNVKESPGWNITIKQCQYFTNTEGGSLPAGLEHTVSYMPLNTSLFNSVLNAQANNVQSAMDMLDDHTHSGLITGRIVANTTALTQTEGYLRWDSTRKMLILWDGQRERAITPAGWLPFAYPMGFVANATYTTALALAANGGSAAIPIHLAAPMLLESVSLYNVDTTLARTWGWDIYEQYLNNGNSAENTLTRIAQSNGTETWTASAVSKRSLGVTSPPVFLAPGIYWLVLQNRHASNTFGLGNTGISGFVNDMYQTKTTTNPNGSILDFVAATWTKITSYIPAVRLNGRAFGQTTLF